MRGRLIVFEGVEGAGKSTQLDRLAGHLTRAAIPVRTLREPGGTPIGDEIRRLLLDPESKVSPRAEALMFMAARAELVMREARPALFEGKTVLMDRFFLSTYAYQIVGRRLPEVDLRAANLMATEGLTPDLTLLLTLDPQEGLARALKRSAADRIERSGVEFHRRVARAFAEFATNEWQATHEECGRIVTIDASGGAAEVEARMLEAVATRFPELRPVFEAVA